MEIVGLYIAVAKATSWCGVIGWRNGCCALIGACRCHEIKYLFATKDPYQIVNHNKQYLISKNKK